VLGVTLRAGTGDDEREADFEVRAGNAELRGVQLTGVALSGMASVNGEEIAVRVASARLGASRLGEGSLGYGLKDGSVATVSDFDLDLAQAMDATRRLLPEEPAKALARIQPVAGRAQGQAKFEMRDDAWSVLVDIRKSDASVGIEGLPGPVKLAGASVGV